LKKHPEAIADLAPALRERSNRLNELFVGHLSLEEETVFPAMREFLSQQDMDAIRAEMKERRK
jgi:hemerythrin-like domain-containing protein